MNDFAQIELHLALEKNIKLTNTISEVLSKYGNEQDSTILFRGLLESIIKLTDSEYGFIGEVKYNNDQLPYIVSYATSNISWNEQTRALFEQTNGHGMVFSKLDSLYGAVLTSTKHVISNRPASDRRSGGTPHGHPELKSFLGLPIVNDDKLVGMVGVANKKHGYDEEIVEYLAPLLATCGNLIQAYKHSQQHSLIKQELLFYKERLKQLNQKATSYSDLSQAKSTLWQFNNYTFDFASNTLYEQDSTVPLTKKESLLLNLLLSKRNKTVVYSDIRATIWKGVIVSDSTFRALILRLRKKVPNLLIKTVSGIGLRIELNSQT